MGAKQSIEGTYANAQNKYGVFPEGENAARVVDVPQKMNDETNVTHFVRTEMEAKVTPDSLIPVFEKAVEKGDFSYNKVTDKSAVDYAAKQIEKNGYEKSIGEFTSKVDGSKILTKNDLVIGEIQTEFNISEMFQNALTGAIVGGGFGAVKASPEIASTAKDIVEAVKNGKAIESVQTQQEAPAGEVLEQAANIPTETKTEQEAPFASPTEKTFEQRAEELYKQGKSWGEIGKILQAEYHPDWNVDNVKKEARNYIRKSDFYGEKGTANIDNSENTVYAENSQFATIAPYYNTNITAENKAEAKNANVKNLIKEMGENYYGTDYQPTQSKLLYAGDRADVYRKGLEKSEQTGGDGLRDYYLSAQSANEALRNRQRQINKQAENEAGAESPGFSDGQNSLDYSALQNITNTLYGKPDAENKDIYAPFYPKDNRPEGNNSETHYYTHNQYKKGSIINVGVRR